MTLICLTNTFKKEISRAANYLKKPTLKKSINLDACEGPSQDASMSSQDISMSSQDISFGQCSLSPKKKRKRASSDQDFVPEDDSDDENVCPFSKCETERNEFKLKIEKLEQEMYVFSTLELMKILRSIHLRNENLLVAKGASICDYMNLLCLGAASPRIGG